MIIRRIGAILLGLALGIGTAAAQFGDPDRTIGAAPPAIKPSELTPSQRTAILHAVQLAVQKERKTIRPPTQGVELSVGAQVPPSMELYMLPDHILIEAPATKALKYTLLDNKVVLVDPTNLRIVDVIDR